MFSELTIKRQKNKQTFTDTLIHREVEHCDSKSVIFLGLRQPMLINIMDLEVIQVWQAMIQEAPLFSQLTIKRQKNKQTFRYTLIHREVEYCDLKSVFFLALRQVVLG